MTVKKFLRVWESKWTRREPIDEVHNWVTHDDSYLLGETYNPHGKTTCDQVITNNDAYGCQRSSSQQLLGWLDREQKRNPHMKLMNIGFRTGRLRVKVQSPQVRSNTFSESQYKHEAKSITMPNDAKKRRLDISINNEKANTSKEGSIDFISLEGNIRGTGGTALEALFSTRDILANRNYINVPKTSGTIEAHNSTGSATMDAEFSFEVPESSGSGTTTTKTTAATRNDISLFLLRGLKTDTMPIGNINNEDSDEMNDWWETRPRYLWEEEECEKYYSWSQDFIYNSTFHPYFRPFNPENPSDEKVDDFKINGEEDYYIENFEKLLKNDSLCFDKFVFLIENHNRIIYDAELQDGNYIEDKASVTYQFQHAITLELTYFDPEKL